ncbi:hypothetical protein Y1Q_0003841 [Alligator mississippiensis]|uniref:Uncharacterized protein n=1 Tax=Alligator mississippiensis TaxID=8496 RepID=A0A151MNH3_ALLMI|nr:hypothetical protein Y1Q_0003841 [Alligator mississippiensis]
MPTTAEKVGENHEVICGLETCLSEADKALSQRGRGYELHGVENIPQGPGVIIYYHGPVPLDYLYFAVRLFLSTRRMS